MVAWFSGFYTPPFVHLLCDATRRRKPAGGVFIGGGKHERGEYRMSAGRPKAFNSASKLIELFRQFSDEIIENGFKDVPTQTSFSRWLKSHFRDVDRRTIYNALNKYFPEVKEEFDQIRADVLAQGALLGHYHSTMAIFGLKNWCHWTDKQQVESAINTKIEFVMDDEIRSYAE